MCIILAHKFARRTEQVKITLLTVIASLFTLVAYGSNVLRGCEWLQGLVVMFL